MFSDNDIDIIKDIVIATVPGVDSIFLFGSQARGTAFRDSGKGRGAKRLLADREDERQCGK